MNQAQSVENYFDHIAYDYAQRYGRKGSFHNYFFDERLKDATKEIDFNYKSVLDIGAGTGVLYDYLIKNYHDFRYVGVDLSSKMLHESNIPSSSQLLGDATKIKMKGQYFDYIFMLGLTTYLSHQSLLEHIDLCSRLLREKGILVISFTNRKSFDSMIRRFIGPFVRTIIPGSGVLQQPFAKSQYSMSNVIDIFEQSFEIERVYWQNQTVTPFNQLFPLLSASFARQMKKNLPNCILPIFSSDFLISFKKK